MRRPVAELVVVAPPSCDTTHGGSAMRRGSPISNWTSSSPITTTGSRMLRRYGRSGWGSTSTTSTPASSEGTTKALVLVEEATSIDRRAQRLTLLTAVDRVGLPVPRRCRQRDTSELAALAVAEVPHSPRHYGARSARHDTRRRWRATLLLEQRREGRVRRSRALRHDADAVGARRHTSGSKFVGPPSRAEDRHARFANIPARRRGTSTMVSRLASVNGEH